jgi:hypothetical protein
MAPSSTLANWKQDIVIIINISAAVQAWKTCHDSILKEERLFWPHFSSTGRHAHTHTYFLAQFLQSYSHIPRFAYQHGSFWMTYRSAKRRICFLRVISFVHLNRSFNTLNQPEEQDEPDRYNCDPRTEPAFAFSTVPKGFYQDCSCRSGVFHGFFQQHQPITPELEPLKPSRLMTNTKGTAFNQLTVYQC